ncbi:MAG: HAMP domain-containing sensor histidine kinase [Opitutaceae bacterium]|nr:HAMP domain-containing sensor histidine kinase [Opitutaceae bacterium]
MCRFPPPLATATLLIGSILVAIFAAMVIRFRADLQSEIHLKIIERDAAVLYPVARLQVEDSEAGRGDKAPNPYAPLTALLKSARQEGMLAIAVFDPAGSTIETVPATQPFVELEIDDYLRLQGTESITRYHPAFPLDQYFVGVAPDQRQAPVLEVLLAIRSHRSPAIQGFVRYYIDARPLSRELALIDRRIYRQTAVTLTVGTLLVALVMTAAYFGVQRAQRAIAERNERLTRANFELTLSAKASALGQITSHLIHGLQVPMAGLQAVVTGREAGQPGSDWETVAGYTKRMQTLIQETVALLGDAGTHTSYELTGQELAATIRNRYQSAAAEKGVLFEVGPGFPARIDSHRGSLLCLIAGNLVQNAIAATAFGRRVEVSLDERDGMVVLKVRDEGPGISDSVRQHLFKPGRSSRPGGSGLGLAISHLLARQVGANLALLSTGPEGTVFSVTMPLTA